jgi:signal peptidase II
LAGPLSPIGLAIVVGVIILDQVTKGIAEAVLPLHQRTDILPILALFRVHNPGIAFSFLEEFDGLGLFIMPAAITAAVIVLWWRAAAEGTVINAGFAFIVGGAAGNLIDRAVHGHVVDFLLLYFGAWTLFVFNFADAALTLGPIMLIAAYVWPRRA